MLQAARTMPDTLAHPAAADARPDLIVVQGVSKRFGSTAALQDVSLRGRAGSIHAITGENGAGKSTLMKLLAGVHLKARTGEFTPPGMVRWARVKSSSLRLVMLTVPDGIDRTTRHRPPRGRPASPRCSRN